MNGANFIRFLKGRIHSNSLNAFRSRSKTQVSKLELPVLDTVARSLSEPSAPASHACGICFFGALVFLLGSAPELLPHCFLIFIATCLPWRVASFGFKKWTFFLFDYCYFANVAVAAYFCWLAVGEGWPSTEAAGCDPDQCAVIKSPASAEFASLHAGLQGAVYMLAEGPLAAAIIPWQCSWVMDSASHSVSVGIHLLPGLALFAHRWLTPEVSMAAALVRLWETLTWNPSHGVAAKEVSPPLGGSLLRIEGPHGTFLWLVAVPLLAYCAWQMMYLIIVQFVFRRFILARGYSTSYSSLARRAAKANNFLNRFVRRGSAARRVVLFGLMQLAFTLLAFFIGYATYQHFHAAVLWQVVKFVVPLYYGAQYTTCKVPVDTFRKGVQQLIALQLASESLLKDARPMTVEWVPNTRIHSFQSN